jgi:serine/threonine-protein kinase
VASRPDVDAAWTSDALAVVARSTAVRATITARTYAGGDALAATAAIARVPSPADPGALATLPSLPLAEGDGAAGGAAELAVIGLLGEGGMGRVLLARQRSLGRDVAVKVAKPSRDRGTHAALLAEARVLGHLEHPGIVPVHALGRDDDGNPVLVMKRIEGVPWSALLADPAHAFWDELATAEGDRRAAHLGLLSTVCGAVHYAHRRGVIHRDLKPDNVMVGPFGEVYVTDWGIALARGGATGTPVLGTPAYMAPEMVGGDARAIDERTDVYLLGAILHEILTGTQRNPGRTVLEALRSAIAPEPVAYGPDVPDELAAIANRATAASPDARFPDARSLERALAAHLRHEGALTLARAAEEKLAALRAAVATPPGERTADGAAEIERLGAECRFAFAESRKAWPENAAARGGAAECVAVLVGDRVARGDAHGARALLAEIDEPPAELVARVEALEAELAAKAGDLARLAAMERDLDPRVAARERAIFMSALLAVTLVFGLFRLVPGDHGANPAALELLAVPTALLVLTSLGLALGGRRRLATAFNRRAGAFVVLGLAINVVHRALALHAGESPRAIHRTDSLLLATVMLAAAITQVPAVALGAVPLLLAAALMPASPTAQLVTFGLATSIGTAIATIAAARDRRRGSAGPGGP